jgi:N-acetylglutamate synthase-like GNAT family acetyltransferase
MSFTLRPATATDQPTIKAMVRAARINPQGLEWPRFVMAVDEQEQPIGCAQVKPHKDGTRELASIVVVEPWRGRGVARALIEHLMAQHGRPLWLTCTSSLIPLYQKFGFRELTDNADLSPYFRRLARLARLILFFARTNEYLAVMRWAD